MEKKFDILVVGELNVDLILNQLQSFPKLGVEIMARQMTLTLGSSSAIFAANASTLGAKVAFAGKLGADSFGDLVLTSLKERGIDTSFVYVDHDSATGISVIFRYAQDRAIVTYPGAMEEFSCDDISDQAFAAAKHLHVSSIFLQPQIKACLEQLFTRAKQKGLTTSLDPQWDPAEQWDVPWDKVLPLVDVFLPNDKELLSITGKRNIDSALRSLGQISPNTTIVAKMGAEGAKAFHQGQIYFVPAYKNENVVDAVGAGDSFDAGFIVKFISGSDLKTALRFANLMGAINTTAAGGTGAFGSMEQVRTVALERFNEKI